MSRMVSARLDQAEFEKLAEYMQASGQSAAEVLRDATRRLYSGAADELRRQGRAAADAQGSPYSFDGRGEYSFVRDLATQAGDPEAAARLATYGRLRSKGTVSFDTVTTSSAAEVIPPGYRPIPASTPVAAPLTAAAERVTIADATPFAVPREVEASGAAVTPPDEVTPPAGASLSIPPVRIVTPKVLTGSFVLTRELLDSASPAADVLVVTAARMDYERKLEQLVYAELNGAEHGQGGTLTGGYSAAGARVRTVAGEPTPEDAAAALRLAVAEAVTELPFDGGPARGAGLSRNAALALAPVLDDTTTSTARLARGSAAMADAAADDADVLVLSDQALWVFTSPQMELRFGERSGPDRIEIALWSHAAVALLRPNGLSAVRFTGS